MKGVELKIWDDENKWMYDQDEFITIIDKNGISSAFDTGSEFKGFSEEHEEKLIYRTSIGRKDKNNKTVFSGDILKCKDLSDENRPEFVGYVDFKDCSFVIIQGCITNYRWMDYEVEVIGDIYRNKELLEDEI